MLVKLLIIFPRGNMCMDYKMGPKTDPWGIPHDIAAESDRFFHRMEFTTSV